MAAIVDFASLQQAVTDNLARSDLAPYVPDFIAMAETWLNFGGDGIGAIPSIDPLRCREMEASTTLLLSANVTVTAPANGTLSQSAGGSLSGTTYFVTSTWVTTAGESLASAETSFAVSANNVLNVGPPSSTAPANATGWNVYVSVVSGAETLQNGNTPIALGATWVEPTSGLVAGVSSPVASAPIPSDYLEYIRVTDNASWRGTLKYLTPDQAQRWYPNQSTQAGGFAEFFSIVGSNLYIYPSTGNSIGLLYYQKIPALSSTNTTNWLLAKSPNLYLRATLAWAAEFIKDKDEMATQGALAASLAGAMNRSDILGKYARAGITFRGGAPS